MHPVLTKAPPVVRAPRAPRRFSWLPTGGGVLAGLLLLEALFRLVATPFGGQPEPAGYTVRQYNEGIAVSHFYTDGARVTGNGVLPGAPTVLLLGDSFVMADGVRDEDTMGARIERALRAAGVPVNVRAYGWTGASGPHYVVHAPALTAAWQPVATIVFLNKGDLGVEPLQRRPTADARFTVAADGSYSVVPTSNVPSSDFVSRIGRVATHHSVLFHLLYTRFQLVAGGIRFQTPWQKERAPARGVDPRIVDLVPSVTVRALRQAYPRNLLLAYDHDSTGGDFQPAPGREERFLAACAEFGVKCVPMAAKIASESRRMSAFPRGFPNSNPNSGHYNETGHEIVAGILAGKLLEAGLVSH